MSFAPLNRRTILQTSALAAGSAALGPLAQPAEAAGQPAYDGPALVSGSLSGWVVVDLHREAVIRFAHLRPGASPLELGAPVRVSLKRWSGLSHLDQMGRATAAAHGVARTRLARAWGVARQDCVFETRRIRNRRSGRAIGYSVWVDLA